MRRLPPLHALRAFEAAARHLHFSKAAEELNLTPTAVSHQVRHLEDILGVTLFHRYPRPVRLSPEGETLYPVLREALDRVAAAVEDISAVRLDRPLTVSVTMAFASRWLTPRLPSLRAETGLAFAIEAEDRPVDLHASDVDIAIRYSEAPGQGAEWVRLFDDRIVPVCAPPLLQGRSPDLDPGEIAGLPLIHYRWKSKSKDAPSWERWFARAAQGLPGKPAVQTFSEEVHAIDAAVAGQGVVLASEVLVSDLLARGELIRVSQITLPGLAFWGVFLSSNPRAGELKLFMDWMRKQK
ncbi:LysR substrate-binding domain-containing protein [Rhizobium sp. LC145]|uniref:LysR substrate-binding domain-containing protein n=1 Tax=Rhizobium sp. LC145 TaxID=1120688 RepID=UPI00062A262C|nr:LysR substrate-binding domain-containing protein [Rhizobium sp. LC145]KKX28420.1 LysR family transcriptional regulator [Rhizobium sp. LC145]TKT58302.1 LysR family transcriptional regulator [Rhizobiaceae bacterium LC148]